MSSEGKGVQVPHLESSLKKKEKSSALRPESPDAKESNAGSQDFPEGGFWGWSTAIGACVQIQFSLWWFSTLLMTFEQISRSVLHVWVSYLSAGAAVSFSSPCPIV